MRKLTVLETKTLCESVAILEKCLGDSGSKWLGRMFFFASEEQKKLAQESLDEMYAFFELPLEERFKKMGAKENENVELELDIELPKSKG